MEDGIELQPSNGEFERTYERLSAAVWSEIFRALDVGAFADVAAEGSSARYASTDARSQGEKP